MANLRRSGAAPADIAWVVLALMLLLAQLPSSGPRPLADLSTHELAQRFPTPARVEQRDFCESQDAQPFWELAHRIGTTARPSLEDWRCILLDRGWLRWRDRWPQDLPFAVGMHRPWSFLSNAYLELVPRVKGWARASWGRSPGCTNNWEAYEQADYQVLGALTGPEMSIEFDLYDVRPDFQTGSRTGPLGSITLHVRAVKSIEDCLPPLEDKQREAEIGRRLACAVQLRGSRDSKEDGPMSLTIDPAVRTPGVALGLDAILKQAGHAPVCSWGIPLGAAREFRWEAGGANMANYIRAEEADNLIERMTLMQPVPHVFDSLHVAGRTLVLRGNPQHALRDWDAKEYWAGEIEVPLADMIRR